MWVRRDDSAYDPNPRDSKWHFEPGPRLVLACKLDISRAPRLMRQEQEPEQSAACQKCWKATHDRPDSG